MADFVDLEEKSKGEAEGEEERMRCESGGEKTWWWREMKRAMGGEKKKEKRRFGERKDCSVRGARQTKVMPWRRTDEQEKDRCQKRERETRRRASGEAVPSGSPAERQRCKPAGRPRSAPARHADPTARLQSPPLHPPPSQNPYSPPPHPPHPAAPDSRQKKKKRENEK